MAIDWQRFQIVFGDYFSDSIEWYEQANLSFDNTLKAPCEGLSIMKNFYSPIGITRDPFSEMMQLSEKNLKGHV